MEEQDRNAILAEMNRLQKIRSGVVGVAVVLLVISLVAPSMALAVLRSIAWVSAGVVVLLHASKAKQVGVAPNYGSAVLYFLVAVIPLIRGR
jgi:hypothetical protein